MVPKVDSYSETMTKPYLTRSRYASASRTIEIDLIRADHRALLDPPRGAIGHITKSHSNHANLHAALLLVYLLPYSTSADFMFPTGTAL